MDNPDIYDPPAQYTEVEVSKVDWWRWPLVPIGSVIGATLGAMLLGGMNWLFMKMNGGMNEDGLWYRFVQPVMVFGLFGYLWSTLAYMIAPHGKLIAAVVMTTVLGMLCVFVVIKLVTSPDLPTSNKIMSSIAIVASLICGISGVVQYHSEHDPYG